MPDDLMQQTNELKALALSLGADLVGMADLALLRGIYTYPENLLAPFQRGISVAVRLSDPILDAITPHDPTKAYAHHYETVNALLDQITLRLAGQIQRQGYKALPIPASLQVGPKSWYGAISHKAVARAAGLGWIGANLLLITPDYGPRIRLATVLTDMPLLAGAPSPRRCGTCQDCIKACPARALLGWNQGEYPQVREIALDTAACAQRLDFFAADPQVGQPICGVCVQVCPWGKQPEMVHRL